MSSTHQKLRNQAKKKWNNRSIGINISDWNIYGFIPRGLYSKETKNHALIMKYKQVAQRSQVFDSLVRIYLLRHLRIIFSQMNLSMLHSCKNKESCLDNKIEANNTEKASFRLLSENLLAKIPEHNILPNEFVYVTFM